MVMSPSPRGTPRVHTLARDGARWSAWPISNVVGRRSNVARHSTFDTAIFDLRLRQRDAHAPRGAHDDSFGRLEVVGVEVFDLQLGQLAQLGAVDGADLGLVGRGRTL